MGHREDQIYELQRALAGIAPESWPSHLEAVCPSDPELREEVLRRQAQQSAETTSDDGIAFAAGGSPDGGAPTTERTAPDEGDYAFEGTSRFAIRRQLGSGAFAQFLLCGAI